MSLAASIFNVHPADLVVSTKPLIIAGEVTSGLVVCIFSDKSGVGGIAHFAKPSLSDGAEEATDSLLAGDVAIPTLIEEICQRSGDKSENLRAKLVGAQEDGVSQDGGVGAANVTLARQILARYGVSVVGESVGGWLPRKLLFHTHGGRLQISHIEKSVAVAAPSSSSSSSSSSPPVEATQQMSTKKTKIVLIFPERRVGQFLASLIENAGEFRVCGLATNRQEFANLATMIRFDLIIGDFEKFSAEELQDIGGHMHRLACPLVMVSSDELSRGSLFYEKYASDVGPFLQHPNSVTQSRNITEILEKIRHAVGRIGRARRRMSKPRLIKDAELDLRKVLCIGASTGGTEAIAEILTALPARIPPVLIVQHIPPVFSRAFAERMNTLCPFAVREAKDGDLVEPGVALVAPGGRHMKVEMYAGKCVIKITDDERMNRHRPSVDYLFLSVAKVLGEKTIGVILTGMGNDGARGLLAMRNAGARTLSQDEESSVVYGMPKVAYEIGASEQEVPLEKMAPAIVELLGLDLNSQKKSA